MKVTVDLLEDFARGAAFLGTGGGGDPYIGRLAAQHAIEEYGPPDLISLDELDDDTAVYPVVYIGAPTIFIEKLICGDDMDFALSKLEEITGRKAGAIISAEVGGVNSIVPFAVAARRGLPVVDADGMGRAFPEVQMVTFNVYGVPASPAVIVNEHLEHVVVHAHDAKSTENKLRAVATEMGLGAGLSCYPMTGKQVKDTAVGGTLSLAHGIGRAIVEGRKQGDPIESLLAYLRTTPYYNKCKVLFDGKIVDLLREVKGGWNIGTCVLEALDGGGSRMEIVFQNENLIARVDGKTKVIVPDLVCVVDRESGEPVTTETLRYGQRVKIIGVSAAPIMRTPEALAVFGPRMFGFDEDFVPIEDVV